MSVNDPERLAEAVLGGSHRGLARAISLIENDWAQAEPLMRRIYPHSGRAYVVGVTGPPGAGKSTMVNALVATARRGGDTVAVLAVDPSSPFTGGAVLGDRVRMTGHSGDAGVFVRSMATRGTLGGLSRATADTVALVDAAGFGIVLIETVGVGQDEIDIVRNADTSVVMFVPGAGDDVQAIKAGIMEIGDVIVVNKADRDGSDQVVHAIRAALSLAEGAGALPPVLKTVATTGEGVDEVWEQITRRRNESATIRLARRRLAQRSRLRELVYSRLRERFDQTVSAEEVERCVDDLLHRRTDPYAAATALLELSMRRSKGAS
jgi:LAO/AO transport system kinase